MIHYTKSMKDKESAGYIIMRAKIRFQDHGLLDYQVLDFRIPMIGEYYIHEDLAILAQINFMKKKLIVRPIFTN